jgi:peptide/nickel transport system substrate-binding protein
LYKDAVYDVLWYNVLIQAYRSDKWTGYVTVPPGGKGAPFRDMLRTTYIDLKPRTAAVATSGGSSTGVIFGVVVAAVVVLGVAVVLVRRRRPQQVEAE